MKRSDLISKIEAENPALTHAEADRIVKVIFERIAEHIATGGRVEIRGFGVFTARQRDARLGRNPRTGEAVAVEGKSVPFFKAGKLLTDRLNGQ